LDHSVYDDDDDDDDDDGRMYLVDGSITCICAVTMQPPVGSVAMMQIDCEVTATKLVHIHKSAIPDHMLHNSSSGHQHHQRTDFSSRRPWVVSDPEN